jgi:hypothetical protein
MKGLPDVINLIQENKELNGYIKQNCLDKGSECLKGYLQRQDSVGFP